MKYRNHIAHSDRFLDYYKDGYAYLRPSSIQKRKLTHADGTKYTYLHIIKPYVTYTKYKDINKIQSNWRAKTPNASKLGHMVRDAASKFVYENCCFCNSDKNIIKHHENYDMWNHFYFMCQSCHISYHTGRFDK